jgi:DNA-binding CsgD family transcriptional regulator
MHARGRPGAEPVIEKLIPAELQVLQRVVAGRSIPEVAEALAISEKTARNHVRNVVAKLALLVEDEPR